MDFPKTIYVGENDYESREFTELEPYFANGDIVAIYTLKEVKKKVTEVKLEDL